MSRNPRCIAPALLASLFASFAASAVRAEPAPAPAANAADCLAKPNAPAAAGNHWYYRLDRPSGRHCWYQRPATAAPNEAGHPRSAPARVDAAASVDQPAAAPSTDTPDARDRGPVPTVSAAPAPPPAWPAASPAPAPSEEMTAPASDRAASSSPTAPSVEPAGE